MNDSPALPSGYLRKAALRKYPLPKKRMRPPLFPHCFCFHTALHDGGKARVIPHPGHIARKRSTQSKLRGLPLPECRSCASDCRSFSEKLQLCGVHGLPRQRIMNEGRPIFSDKTNPSPQSNIHAGRPTARRPSAGSAVRHGFTFFPPEEASASHTGRKFQEETSTVNGPPPQKIFSRFPARSRVHRKRGNTYE